MSKKWLTKSLSVLLVVVMLVTSIPMSGFAAFDETFANTPQISTDYPQVDYSVGNKEGELRLPLSDDEYDITEEYDAYYGDAVSIDQYSKVYEVGERKYTAIFDTKPNFYYDKNGKKKGYDNSLQLQGGVNGSFTNVSSDIDVKLSTDIAKKGLTFNYDGVKIGLIPVNGNYDTYTIVDNAVRYNNVYEGIDVQYSIQERGIQEFIILNKEADINSFSYRLNLNGHTVKLVDNILYVYENAESKECPYTISAPIMTDASGNESGNVVLTLEGDILTVTADAQWLYAPERAYPVYIDPDIEVRDGIQVRSVVEDGDRVYISATPYAYGYAGYIHGANFGFNGNLGGSKMLVSIPNGCFNSIPEGAGIISADFHIYQYVAPKKSTSFQCSMITDPWNINDYSTSARNNQFTKASGLNIEYLSSSSSKVGWHAFNVRTAVNNWVNNLVGQNGFMITGTYNNSSEEGGAFVTNTSTASTEGQASYYRNKPYLTVTWEVPNPVDLNYDLNNTTINLRTVGTSDREGKLAILGVFADGLAKPYSVVDYTFSDTSAENQSYSVRADISKKYPDSTAWNETFASAGRATKYKDVQSNWQTVVPFTQFNYNQVYNWHAKATLNGVSGNSVKSPDFLVYKITRFDTLSSIANYYGVSVDKLATDNHVQDMLLVENNTIIVIDPTKNATKPYNPPELTNSEKAKIDGLLMGRGKHCEFGFEPVNINTGNFYMNQTDISIADFNGDFAIERTYNSKAFALNSVFGRGWQFDFAESLARTAEGFAYRRGDGSTVNFYLQSDGSYASDPGYYLSLNRIAVGTKLGDFGGEELEEYTVYEYEITSAEGEVHRFSSRGLLTSIKDKKGFVTSIAYDANNNFASITSPAGQVYTITSRADGKITQITIPTGYTLSYEYNENDDLVGFYNELNNKVTYSYDNSHRMLSWSDAENNVIVTNTYDSEGRVTTQTDANGDVTLFAYSNGQTITTDANGNVTTYHFDESYRTTSIVYADGSSISKAYDADNNLAEEVDRSGNATHYRYDAKGNMIESRRFDGAVQKYTYDANNNLVETVDFDGKSTKAEYDAKGNIIKSTNKDGSFATFAYDENNRLISATDANGNITNYSYAGIWVSEVTNALGAKTKYYYDACGRVVTAIDANGNTTRYIYDAAGRKTAIQFADGSCEEYAYDKSGCMVKLTTQNGYVYGYEYDGLGNITKLIDPLLNEVSYTYDGLYNTLSTTYAEGIVESKTYDSFSLVTSLTNEEGSTTCFAYDNAGNETSIVDPMGNATSYTYDLRFNKVTSQKDALGNITKYEYDTIGNLVKQTAANGAITQFSYDDFGNITTATYANGFIKSFTYDSVGNLLTESDNTGKKISYAYDKAYNIVSITYDNGAELSYTFDALGNKLTETDSLGATTTYTYDVMGRQSSITDSVGRSTSYAYDGVGNLLSTTASNGSVTTYTYDALDRLRKTTDALGNTTFTEYDSLGNKTSDIDALGAKTSYSYNKIGLPLTATDPLGGKTTFTYDKNGNLVGAVDAAGFTASFRYDALGRTVSTTDALGLVTDYSYDSMGNLVLDKKNNGETTLYEYDAMGLLTKSTDSLGRSDVYTYDKSGNLISVKSHDGSIVKYAYDTLSNITSMIDPESKKTTYTYDIVGNLVSQKDSSNRENKYSYDKAGRTLSVTDPLGNVTNYEYNEFDLVTRQTNPAGKSKHYTYDLGGNLISETDENGSKTEYVYDKAYRLLSAKYADGTTNKYQYDLNGNLLKFTDANGNNTEYAYNALGYTTAIKDAVGAVTKYETDASGNVTKQIDALGNVTLNTYDKTGKLVSTKLANGATYAYEYDLLGRKTKETLPEGLSNTYSYDSSDNLQSVTDQSGRVTRYTYDIMHRLLTTTDAKGNVTKLGYDGAGNLATLTTAKGAVTKYSYDKLDRVTNMLDPMNVATAYTYDPVGNLTQTVENGGRVTKYEYDAVGNMTKLTNALGYSKSFTYSSVYNLTKETDYKGNAVSYSYDANGNVLSETDRVGKKTEYSYNAVGKLTSEKDAAGRNKKYSYDKLGQLISVVEDGKFESKYTYDSVGNLITAGGYTYEYDLLSNMTSAKNAIGNVTEYIYNRNGLLSVIKNADGSTVNYDYDAIDNIISKKYDGSEQVALYGYDADGNCVSMDDIAGATGYEYDKLGRITAVKLSGGKKIKYSYDGYGNITSLGYPDGTVTKYNYDKLGQMTSVVGRDGNTVAYKYDQNGNVTEVHRPNNTYTEMSYDANDRITKLVNYGMIRFFGFFKKTVPISSFVYDYDASGNIIKETSESFSSTGENDFFTWLIAKIKHEHTVTEYEYDGRNQLTRERVHQKATFGKKKTDTTTYDYDVSGNRTSKNENGKKTSYSYNKAGQLIKESGARGTINYKYDLNGNLISENSKTYTYDNENRLTAIKESGSLLMAALYDGNGDRLFVISDHDGCSVPCCNEKSCSNLDKDTNEIDFNDSLIINALLVPNGVSTNSFKEYDLTGYINNVNSEYTQVLMEYAANEKITATYEYGINRESAVIDGNRYYYHYDARGSVNDLVNTSGKKAVTYEYDAFGITHSSCSTVENPYQYNAEYTDNATGLQYLRARYYRAQTGSFITADTYAGQPSTPLSLNRYTYTHNNPIMGRDPSGHSLSVLAVVGIVAAVSAGISLLSTGASHISKRVANSKKAEAEAKQNERNTIESNRVSVEQNAVSTKTSNSSATTRRGNSVNYKNTVYTFKTEVEAQNYFSMCEQLDSIDSEIAKLKESEEKWKKASKVFTTVSIASGTIAAVGGIVATGGTALAPLLVDVGAKVGISVGVAEVVSYTVGGIGIASSVGSGTLNIIDTWKDTDDPTFNAWQKGLNITSTVSNGIYSIGNIYNSVKGWVAKHNSNKTPTSYDEIYADKKTLKPDIEYDSPDGTKYTTNSEGKIDTVEFDRVEFGEAKRNNYAQSQVGKSESLRPKKIKVSYEINGKTYKQKFNYKGKFDSYDGGHLKGNQFAGSGGYDNLISQPSVSNRPGGDWFNMEKSWSDALKNNGSVTNVKMKLFY